MLSCGTDLIIYKDVQCRECSNTHIKHSIFLATSSRGIAASLALSHHWPPLDGICHSQQIICMTDVYGPYIPEPEDGYIDVSGNCRIAIERLFEKADLMM